MDTCANYDNTLAKDKEHMLEYYTYKIALNKVCFKHRYTHY